MAKREKKNWSYILTVVSCVLAATLVGGIYGERLLGSPVQDDFHKRMKEYNEAVAAAARYAPDEIGTEKIVYSSIEGMLRTLDPHTSFLEPTDYSEMQDRQKGTFYGLGILVTKRNDQVTVITPLEGTPAARLGVRAGDIISEVDGTPTEDLPLDEVVKKLKGPKGTTVHIKIMRTGIQDPIPLAIVRAAIPTNSISNTLMVRPGIGYIRIKDFTYTTVRELDDSIAKLEKQGMQKLILDLRLNPGGLLDAAVGVSDHFLSKGEMIVYTKGRTAESQQELLAPGKHELLTIPVVVIINHGSASASEIVAGAIQDHDRGLVIGETSWGKGLVQSVYTLQYGAGLALTTSKYYTPSGRNIQRDYSSFYDYYVADDASASSEVPDAQRKVFHTDTGRTVYGGGGITPDVVVKPRELSRTTQLLEVRSAIFNFGVDYVARNPDVTKDVVVTPQMLEDFVRFAAAKEVATTDDVRKALQTPVDHDYVARALKAEIISAKYGYDASYPYRLEGDDQVARAIELFPEAEKLAVKAAALHNTNADSSVDAAHRAATAALPKTN